MGDHDALPPFLEEWLVPDMTDGQVAWHLAMAALSGVRRRVEHEGLTRDSSMAFLERVNDLSMALCQCNAEREAGAA